MASIAPPQTLAPPAPARAEASPAAQAAEQRDVRRVQELQPNLQPQDLHVRLDADAQRFVQTLTDPDTDQTVLRYPSEAQLAYSRAVVAYLRTMRGE